MAKPPYQCVQTLPKRSALGSINSAKSQAGRHLSSRSHSLVPPTRNNFHSCLRCRRKSRVRSTHMKALDCPCSAIWIWAYGGEYRVCVETVFALHKHGIRLPKKVDVIRNWSKQVFQPPFMGRTSPSRTTPPSNQMSLSSTNCLQVIVGSLNFRFSHIEFIWQLQKDSLNSAVSSKTPCFSSQMNIWKLSIDSRTSLYFSWKFSMHLSELTISDDSHRFLGSLESLTSTWDRLHSLILSKCWHKLNLSGRSIISSGHNANKINESMISINVVS